VGIQTEEDDMAINLDDIDAMDVTHIDPDTEVARRRSDVTARLANHARTATYQAPVNHATPKMIGYVMVLLRKLATHNPSVEAIAREWWMRHAICDTDDATRVIGSDLPFDKVSETITKLKGHLDAPAQMAVEATEPPTPSTPIVDGRSPFHVALEAVPEGRYALPVLNDDGTPDGDKHRYFKVAVGKRSNRKYMVEGHGGGNGDLSWGGLVPFEHGALAIAQRLAAGWSDAMVLFGLKTSHCGDCGRSLTNDESRRVGIGPYCRGKSIWAGMPWYDGDTPTEDARAKGEDRRKDHSACTHPRTAAGRAACRKDRG